MSFKNKILRKLGLSEEVCKNCRFYTPAMTQYKLSIASYDTCHKKGNYPVGPESYCDYFKKK